MNNKHSSHRGGLVSRILALCLLCCPTALADLPSPSCVYYGMALDENGLPILASGEVILRINGDEVSRVPIDGLLAPGVNFSLRVPIDNGIGERYDGGAYRSGDPISILVEANGRTLPILKNDALPPVGEPGEIIRIQVVQGEDADGDGLPDAWEQWIINASYFDGIDDITHVHAEDDFDGDGQSNGDEFRAGTYADLDFDYFHIHSHRRLDNGRVEIVFLTVPGKTYCPNLLNLAGVWDDEPFARSPDGATDQGLTVGDGGFQTLYLDIPTESRGYLNLAVE